MDNVVIIEDETSVGEMLKDLLQKKHFNVQCYDTAEAFLNNKSFHAHCLYIIDSKLPGLQGEDVVRAIRFRDKISPVFMISGNADISHMKESLNCGADDYLVKPLQPEVLVTKVLNACKKTSLIVEKLVDVGIRKIPETQSLMRDGILVKLTSTEYRIASLLLNSPNKQMSRQDLLDALGDKTQSARTIDAHIHMMRKKIERIGLFIEAVRGYGYRIIS